VSLPVAVAILVGALLVTRSQPLAVLGQEVGHRLMA